MESPVDKGKARKTTRRELLKLSPVLLVGVFAVPRLRDSLLAKGLAFSDLASSKWFRRGHLARTYSDAELTPFSAFPLNTYDVDDPEVDLENWTLKVSGDVQRPGEYSLAQIKALPKQRQNNTKFLYFECADDYYDRWIWLQPCILNPCFVTRCMTVL